MKLRASSTTLVVTLAVIVCAVLIAREIFWRFEDSLDLHTVISIAGSEGSDRLLHIHQVSDSPVDTVRREFKDIRHGHTDVTLWIEGSADTLHTSISGRYYSEIRTFRISTDSSTQVFLVPNTEHGLPTGWGELVFLTPSGKLSHVHLMAMNVGDVDEDRILEVYDPQRDVFTRLDPATGSWVPVVVVAKHPVKN
jgi:hypothetical protein